MLYKWRQKNRIKMIYSIYQRISPWMLPHCLEMSCIVIKPWELNWIKHAHFHQQAVQRHKTDNIGMIGKIYRLKYIYESFYRCTNHQYKSSDTWVGEYYHFGQYHVALAPPFYNALYGINVQLLKVTWIV